MEAHKESNSRTYIFWTLVVIVIAIVAFIIFMPKTNYNDAFNNVNSISKNYAEEDYLDKSISEYIISVQDYSSSLTTANLAQLNSLAYLNTALTKADDFNLKALTFIKDDGSYQSLAGEQGQLKSDLTNKIDTFQTYCKTTLKQFFEQSPTPTGSVINEVVNAFNNKLYLLTKTYIEFSNKTLEMIEKCSLRTMQVNTTIINTYKQNLKDATTEINKETLSPTICKTIEVNLTQCFNNTYYLTHFN